MRVSTVATILSATAVAILAFPAEASEADIAGPRQRSLRGIDRHLKDKGASSRVFNAGVEPKGAQPKGAQPNGAQPATDGARGHYDENGNWVGYPMTGPVPVPVPVPFPVEPKGAQLKGAQPKGAQLRISVENAPCQGSDDSSLYTYGGEEAYERWMEGETVWGQCSDTSECQVGACCIAHTLGGACVSLGDIREPNEQHGEFPFYGLTSRFCMCDNQANDSPSDNEGVDEAPIPSTNEGNSMVIVPVAGPNRISVEGAPCQGSGDSSLYTYGGAEAFQKFNAGETVWGQCSDTSECQVGACCIAHAAGGACITLEDIREPHEDLGEFPFYGLTSRHCMCS